MITTPNNPPMTPPPTALACFSLNASVEDAGAEAEGDGEEETDMDGGAEEEVGRVDAEWDVE